jgi:hypothetical protein
MVIASQWFAASKHIGIGLLAGISPAASVVVDPAHFATEYAEEELTLIVSPVPVFAVVVK